MTAKITYVVVVRGQTPREIEEWMTRAHADALLRVSTRPEDGDENEPGGGDDD